MTKDQEYFIRGECDRCGAPLSRAKQKGKYICRYCGAIFYNNDYSGSDWEEDIEIPETPEKVPEEPIYQPIQPTARKSKNRWLILLGLGLLVVICFFVIIATNVGNITNSNASKANQSIQRPEMLSQLPKAAKAGESIAYANWVLTVSPEIKVNNNRIAIYMILKNWHDDQQIFRYTPNMMIVYDDLGNTYPLYLGSCDPDVPYSDRQITIKPFEEVEFESKSSWCSGEEDLPLFSGVIPLDAEKLYLQLKAFGVFQNITFVIDL
jgi:uncharacterized Zn finger protein (UPF0148 family)